MVIWEAVVGSLFLQLKALSGVKNMQFGMPVASTLALGSTRRETLGSRLDLLSTLVGFRERFLRAFGKLLSKICVFVPFSSPGDIFHDFGVAKTNCSPMLRSF